MKWDSCIKYIKGIQEILGPTACNTNFTFSLVVLFLVVQFTTACNTNFTFSLVVLFLVVQFNTY